MSFRLAIVISHPIQYYAPIYRELAKLPGLELKVFFACDWGVQPSLDPGFGQTFAWDVPLLEGYAHEFLPIAPADTDVLPADRQPGLARLPRSFRAARGLDSRLRLSDELARVGLGPAGSGNAWPAGGGAVYERFGAAPSPGHRVAAVQGAAGAVLLPRLRPIHHDRRQ